MEEIRLIVENPALNPLSNGNAAGKLSYAETAQNMTGF